MPWSGSAPTKTFARDTGAYSGATAWQQTEAASRGIRADDADTHDQDLASGINGSLQKNGDNRPTGNIDWGGFLITNLGGLSSATEVAVASATTTDVLGTSALFVSVTGTTTITSLGTGTKTLKIVRFTGILMLTHHSTTLILPTGANITTAAGDTMIVTSDASSNARVIMYQRADGSAPGGAASMASLTDGDSWTAEVTVASDTTCNILAAASDFIAISGTTTITSFGTGTNKIRFVRATGAHLLTHNGTSLILPTGADITTASGDTYIVISDGSSNARVYGYQRASGEPLTIGRQTIAIPAGAMVSRTTNGAASGSVEMSSNKNMFVTKDFDTTTQEFVQFSIPMPNSWNEGTISFIPIWSHAATTTDFGVVWALQAVACADDDAGDVAFGTEQTSTDTGGTTNDIYIGPESAAITVAGSPAAGEYVMFQLKRNVSDGSDTMAVDARLHAIKVLYTLASLKDA